MLNKKISSIIFLLLAFVFIISCGSEMIKRYDGPHTLSGNAGINDNSDTQGRDSSVIQPGKIIGSISSVNYGNKEIIVNQKKVVELGTVVYVIVEDKEILMNVTFPMMTTFKCMIVPNQKQYINKLKKGMTVYIKQ